ncbi:MAG TPA: long-chain fatty acid--CoA ligase [Acidimicrobiales bacterium]|jgi:fatty-acyl-CoA synthase|nr:long-chain fatty acid--CoA ligase [Acidimicrobiales bacterium]
MQGLMQDFPLSLTHVFERAERLFPKKAIVTNTPRGRERTTYGVWADRTRRLATVLDQLGISRDGRVATFAWNTERHLELYFAPPCTGRVAHTLNIRLFADQLTYVVNHSADEVIFVDKSLCPLLWPLVPTFTTVRHIVVMDDTGGPLPEATIAPQVHDYETLVTAAEPATFAPIADENQAAAMMYTSGTTGNPKGVVYSHRSIFLHTMSIAMTDTVGIGERDVILPVVPMFHANAWGLAHAGVATGATLVMPGPDLSAKTLAELMESERVTVAAGVPTIWMGVLGELEGRDMSSLRVIPCGGSAVPKSLSEGFREQVGLPILHAWGMTETSPVASVCNLKSYLCDAPPEELARRRTSVGVVTLGLELRVVEPGTTDTLAWDGVSRGELQVRGPWVARTYYNDERAADSFTEDGWLRTGDIAVVDEEGYVFLVDRTKDLVKSGGEWISSVELENAIMAHPLVREAAVIGVAHPHWGERPLACVVLHEGASLSGAEVLDFLRPRVASLWLPDDVVFIDEVPKTSVGKFSKQTLRDRFADHVLPA